MASSVVKRGKLYKDIFYAEHIQKSFEAHRDLKSCLSLRQAMNVFKENEEYIRSHEKTAFLQFLNNYPMSYIFKSSRGPMSLFFQSRTLSNVSMYQQQLKLSILTRLREYMPKIARENITELINQQELVIINKIKTQPFDIVHATNFLFLQRETTNDLLFDHCLQSLKNSNYSILLSVFPRISPMLLKRLGLNDWNILRQFKQLLDFMVYDWHPRSLAMGLQIHALTIIGQLQLHLAGYQRIPIFIDEVLREVIQNLQNQNTLDTTSVQMVFSTFRHLPATYNQKAFNTMRTALISRLKLGNQNFYSDKMPYHRLTIQQIDELYDAGLNKTNILDSMIYIGHHPQVRKWICKSNLLQILYDRYCSPHQVSIKSLSILTVTASLLVEAYKGDQTRCDGVVKVWRQVFEGVLKSHSIDKIALMLPLASILNVIELNYQFKLGLKVNELFKEFVKRTTEYQYLPYLSNVLIAVELYYNSQNPLIIECISTILNKLVAKNTKFHFKYYTEFALLLERSVSHTHYTQLIETIYQKLQPDDAPYFVELYNRFPNKNLRMNQHILDMIWKKQHSFKSIGKLLFTTNYSLFTSPKGYLVFELKHIFNQLEPLLTVQDLQLFKVAELTCILNFCRNFYPSIKAFSKKILLVTLRYAEEIDLKRQGVKLCGNFLGAVAAMAAEYELHEQFSEKVVKLLTVLKTTFPQQLMLALKQIQIGWLFKLKQNSNSSALAIAEILDALSQSGYQAKQFDVMIGLLKLHALQVFNLSPQIISKLQGIIMSAIEQKNSRLTLLTSSATLQLKENIAELKSEKSAPLVRIMAKCLQQSNASHNFQYLWEFVELGYRAKDQSLLTSALNHLSKIQLYPYQITKIFEIIKYFPNLSLAQFAANMLSHINVFSRALELYLAEILFTLHSNQNKLPPTQSQIYHDLFDKSQYILVKTIKRQNEPDNRMRSNRETDENRILLRVLKSLWIAIKTNTFSSKSLQLYKYVLANQGKVQDLIKNKNLEGLTWEYLYYIYPVFTKKFEKELLPPAKPGSKKPFQKQREVAYRRDLFKTQPTLDFLTQQHKNQIGAYLNSLSLTQIPVEKLSQSSDNCFIANHALRGITLPYWVRKDGAQFGLIFLDPRYFNQRNEQKGRVSFMINALEILTNIPIKAVVPGPKIEISPS